MCCNLNVQPRDILLKTIIDNCSSLNLKSPIRKFEYLQSPTFTLNIGCLYFYKTITRIEKKKVSRRYNNSLYVYNFK